MKRFLLLSTLLATYCISFAQTDSLQINAHARLLGRWQTGNLNQVGISPSAGLTLSKKAFMIDLQSTYQFLSVEGFTVINDSWTNVTYKHRPTKKGFPLANIIGGYAKSYKIQHSIFAGVGGGLNLVSPTPFTYFQVHAFGGYINLDFENEEPLSTISIGTLIEAAVPITKQLHFSWNLQTYHPRLDREYWGVNNLFMLNFRLLQNFSFNLSHTIIYNNKVLPAIQKTNTLMQVGIQYLVKKT